MEAQAFSGTVDVEDQEFELSFERLIVREDGAAFALVGSDIYGEFSCEGFAPRMRDGHYAPARVAVRYRTWSDNFEAIIRLQLTDISERCRVQGIWDQDGHTWHFAGLLSQRAGSQR